MEHSMNYSDSASKIKSILYDLSRIEEWWLLSFGLILFAFIPNIYRLNNDVITSADLISLFTSPLLYLSIIVVFCAQIFLFASNNYFDRHVDSLDELKCKRNPVCTGDVKSGEVFILLFVTGIVSLFISFLFNFMTFVFTAFTLFVFYFYTAEPFRFKNKLGLDILSHGVLINTFPYFFCLVAMRDFSGGALFLLAALMMRSVMAQMLQEIRDYEVDRKVERNTVVALGQKRSAWIVFGIYLALSFSTLILITSYQFFNLGVSMFYLFILFLCMAYAPTFYKLINAVEYEYRDLIETMWMGQGRTNYWMGISYAGPFSLYFFIVYFLLI
ncbi:MAG: UbiA family prenyltransferase [Halobacteriota archaeon]|nr:UbiA family prenyltransferase [Halobacteriota archaeon]